MTDAARAASAPPYVPTMCSNGEICAFWSVQNAYFAPSEHMLGTGQTCGRVSARRTEATIPRGLLTMSAEVTVIRRQPWSSR